MAYFTTNVTDLTQDAKDCWALALAFDLFTGKGPSHRDELAQIISFTSQYPKLQNQLIEVFTRHVRDADRRNNRLVTNFTLTNVVTPMSPMFHAGATGISGGIRRENYFIWTTSLYQIVKRRLEVMDASVAQPLKQSFNDLAQTIRRKLGIDQATLDASTET